MDRRQFLAGSCSAGAVLSAGRLDALQAPQVAAAPTYSTANTRWQAAYDKAITVLAGNVRVLPHFEGPVLIEGDEYLGIWQECGPHESLVYSPFRPDVARNTHMTFFALQHANGQLPANNKFTETGFGQIQMVVPIAATAWELSRVLHDDQFLQAAYTACSRWDDWLSVYRNTRGTGLVEGFCTYDTGHDNSPRWAGIPAQCPNKDAAQYPKQIASLPRLCPDLSATVYGGRRALAAMAEALGKKAEAARWTEKAEAIRALTLQKLYAPEDGAFYDLDNQNQFVRVRSDVISRMAGEHVVDQKTFDNLWTKQLGNPKAFWAPFPFSSIAMDDPTYVGEVARNSWGGPTQALTALRTGRWMDHYGRSAEHGELMDRWCDALQRDMTFRQQMNPQTGQFSPESKPGYSPAALVMYDFTWRLAGVREDEGDLRWNARPGHPAADAATFRMRSSKGQTAEMLYAKDRVRLTLNGKPVATISGGLAGLLTSSAGVPHTAVGISTKPQTVTLELAGKAPKHVTLQPNQKLALS